jgi:hypothetical protein
VPRERSTTTVVFFLGGCTYTEIAALRWVGRQNKGQCLPMPNRGARCADTVGAGRHFLIATTGIISGRSMVESLVGTSASAPGKDAAL